MPQQTPDDILRVRNIVSPDGDDIQTFYLTRYRKETVTGNDGQPSTREVPYLQEVEWNFRNGFFFQYGGQPFFMRPGEEKPYPRYLAEHNVKNQVQWILNDMHQKSKKPKGDGTFMYDQNVLKNQNLIKKLREKAIVGVEEWKSSANDDFDRMLAEQFGNGAEAQIEEKVENENVHIGDFEMGTVDMDEGTPLEIAKPNVARSKDPEVQALRDELDINQVPYDDKDGAEQLKAKLVKAMA